MKEKLKKMTNAELRARKDELKKIGENPENRTTEELEDLAEERRLIDEVLDEAFTFDYFKWQQDNNIEITEPFRADGLNRILYKCPHCMTEGMTVGKGIILTCHKCGAQYELDTLGRLKAINVTPKFTHIPDWFAWERDEIRKEIENGTYSLDVPVDIAILKDPKAL